MAELQEDARLSLASSAGGSTSRHPPSPSGSSGSSSEGVIRGYRAEIEPRALGLSLSAVIRVRPAPGQLQSIAERAQKTTEVVECHRITGEDCYFMKAHVRDVEHLEEVIDRFAALGQTTTSIVQSSPVMGRGIALEDGPALASS